MNDTIVTILITLFALIIIIGVVVIIYLVIKIKSVNPQSETVYLIKSLENKIESISKTIDQRLETNNKNINEQFFNNYQHNTKLLQEIYRENKQLISNIVSKVTELNSTNQQILNFTQQFQDFQNIFTNPKHKGIIGENLLEIILSNVLPKPVYQLQYRFSDGDIVDAVVFLNKKIIPIDSKFSTENYKRMINVKDKEKQQQYMKEFIQDIKKRIDETSTYVKPHENTFNLALMFIPSDTIYYDIISTGPSTHDFPSSLIHYAYSKKVLLVSPTSLFAYLQTILLALNTIHIADNLDQIIRLINENSRFLVKFDENIYRLGRNLNTVMQSYNQVLNSSSKLKENLSQIHMANTTTTKLELVQLALADDTDKENVSINNLKSKI